MLYWNSDTYNKLETLGNSKGVSYDCKVDPPFVGYVSDSSCYVHLINRYLQLLICSLYLLKVCKAMDGSWIWEFLLPVLPIFTRALGAFCTQVEGHETICIYFYKRITQRSQPCLWICISNFYWRVFNIRNGQGNWSDVLVEHFFATWREWQQSAICLFGKQWVYFFLFTECVCNSARSGHQHLLSSICLYFYYSKTFCL